MVDRESDSAWPGNRASVSLPESAPSSGRTPGPAFPRRNRLELFTPAERAIYDAMQAVEAVGADPLLTEAVTLLGEAKNKVADFVDRPPPKPAFFFAWYPVIDSDARSHFLAYAKVNAEEGELLGINLALRIDADGGTPGVEDPDGWSDEAYDEFERLLVNVASNFAHPAWKDFPGFREAAFPKERAHGR